MVPRVLALHRKDSGMNIITIRNCACGVALTPGQRLSCSRKCAGRIASASNPKYTQEQRDEIARLWGVGLTMQRIGDVMGISRNAANRQIRSMHLSRRATPVKGVGPYAKREPMIRTNTLQPLASLAPNQLASLGRRPPLPPQQEAEAVEQLRLKFARPSESSPHRTCQWVLTERPWTFCGKPSAVRLCDDGVTLHFYSWCAEHKARVFSSMPVERRIAA